MPVRTRTLIVLVLCPRARRVRRRGRGRPRAAGTLHRHARRLPDPPAEHLRPERQQLTLTVTNRGRLGHTFRIRSKTTSNVLAFTTIQPGESKTRSFKLAPRHLHDVSACWPTTRSSGMYGTLTVG